MPDTIQRQPTIANAVTAAIPAGMTLAQWLISRRALNSATGTITQGTRVAGQGLDAATIAAIQAQRKALTAQQGIATGSVARTDAATAAGLKAQQDATAAGLDAQKAAADKQQGLYQSTIDANKPYSEFGAKSIQQLQDLQSNPNSLTSDPGYKFGLNQGEQAQSRAAAARGTLGNGGQVKAATRYALDYASTKYQDAWNRLMQATGVGERANAANASAGVTLGNQAAHGADEIGNINRLGANEVSDINRTGARDDNATMATLGTQTGQEADNEGNLGTRNAEDQAALTLGQADAVAKNQGLQGNNTNSLIGTLASAAPTIAKAFGIGAGTAAASTAGTVAAGAPTVLGGTAVGATGVTGALGLGGGSGLLGLGAATIPVVGGIIAGGALLAKHFIGQGRKAADKLTGQGGIQHAFEDTLNTIDSQPGYTDAQKWQSKVQAYDKLEQLALDFAKKGSNEKKVASQMFDTIAPLFGKSNPLKAAT